MKIILDAEDIRKVKAIVRWDGTRMRLTKNETGDLEILKSDGRVAGYACGLEARNNKIKEILLSEGQKLEVMLWDEEKQEFVEVQVETQNGILDLRKLVPKE